MKSIFLPKLNSIKIEHYSLYLKQPSFEFTFMDGISAIIGGNGIGKSTFIEIIMYCMLGLKKEYAVIGKKKTKKKERVLNSNFFKLRMNSSYLENSKAVAYLDFDVYDTNVLIGRSLMDNRIVSLIINNEQVVDIEEDQYKERLIKLTGLSTFESLDKIVRTFLFFDEDRRNVAWEADTQDEILRILFYDESFYSEHKILEEAVIHWDTEGRHRSEDRRVERESYNELLNAKSKLFEGIEVDGNSDNIVRLYDSKNRAVEEINELEQELSDVILLYKHNETECNKLLGEKEQFRQQVESINNEITKLESKLYKSIYNKLPDYYLSLEKVMASEGKCLACGNKHKVIRERVLKLKENNQCIVCSSDLVVNEEVDIEVINEINQHYAQKNNLINSVSYKDNFLQESLDKQKQINNKMNMLKDQLSLKQREIIYLDSLISAHNIENGRDTFSQILEIKQKKIDELSKQVEENYRKRDQFKIQINELHKKFSEIIYGLNNHLSNYFNKYASAFIGWRCELTVKQTEINSIPHILYVPKVNGSERESIDSVSESQRFFLDQAFRMAIIDYLQSHIIGFRTFFITETPEGSLDITYEAKVAEMFTLFSKSSNNIIFTSNLNSSRFLMQVYDYLGASERRTRTLNLLEKGNPTPLQENDPSLIELQKRLFESRF